MSLLFTIATSVLGLTIQDPVNKVGDLHNVVFLLHNNVTDIAYKSLVSRVSGKTVQVGKVKTAYALVNDADLEWLLMQDEHIKVLAYDNEVLELYSDHNENPFGSCPSSHGGDGASWGAIRLTQQKPVVGTVDFPKGDYLYNKNSGSKVGVYVIDTGFLMTHEELQGAPLHCVGNGCVPNGGSPPIRNHGTQSASTVRSSTLGVTRATVLISYYFLDKERYEFVSKDCEERKKSGEIEVCVVTMSYGGRYYGAEYEIQVAQLEALYDQGIHLVAAAGNSNSVLDKFNLPAGAPGVIAVGAMEIDDAAASFSCHGEMVDIWAPGKNTKAAVATNDEATGFYSGTSAACPHVAGALAVILGENPSLSPKEAKEVLLEGSLKNVLDLSNKPGRQNNRLVHIPCDPRFSA